MHVRRLFAAAAASALALLGVGLSAAPATAAELVVTNTDNAGAGSLRDTILSSSPGDTIVFDPVVFSTPQTINLLDPAIRIPHTVTIQGPGSDLLTIQRTSNTHVYGIFHVIPADGVDTIDVTLSGMTLNKDAIESDSQLGSAFIATASSNLHDLTVEDVVVTNQYSQDSGGAFHAEMTGDATFTGVTLLSNTSAISGGAIWLYNAASATFTEVVAVGNTALTSAGGAIALQNLAGGISFDRVTIAGNEAASTGGGVWVGNNVLHLGVSFSLFEDNISDGAGGGLFVDDSDGTIEVRASTFDANAGVAGGGLFVDEARGLVSVTNSTFSGSGEGVDLGIAIGIRALTATLQVQSSTIDTVGTDEYAIFVDTVAQDGLPQAIIDLAYSTLVGPGVLWIESNRANSATLWSTIADGSGLAAVRVDGGAPVDAYWSLISSAQDAAIDPQDGVTFGVTDMGLAELADNGGPTPTRMLLSGSPAIDAGDPDALFTPTWDQRLDGYPRVINDIIDIGAIEAPEAVPVLPATGSTVPMWIPIVGGAVLLLGAAALVFTIVSRRRLQAAEAPTPPADPTGDAAATDEPGTPPNA